MNAHLFVYGTLLAGAGHPMAARLQREARVLGPATMRGRLYSLGRYPGLVETRVALLTGEPQCRVHGEVYALNAPAATLRWLDAYEGIVPHRPDLSPYERVKRPVRVDAGGELDAWVYLYRRSVRALPEVEGGRWQSPQR